MQAETFSDREHACQQHHPPMTHCKLTTTTGTLAAEQSHSALTHVKPNLLFVVVCHAQTDPA
jgi:hypothetical protein